MNSKTMFVVFVLLNRKEKQENLQYEAQQAYGPQEFAHFGILYSKQFGVMTNKISEFSRFSRLWV